jgi:hypothetical protein
LLLVATCGNAGYFAYIGLDLDAHVAAVVLSNKFSWHEKVGMNLLLRISCACAAGGGQMPAGPA